MYHASVNVDSNVHVNTKKFNDQIVSNEPVTKEVVKICTNKGIACFGAIWDS